MAVHKVLMLQTGGSIILTIDSVNLLSANEAERQFLTDLQDAVRKYERRAAAEGEPLKGGPDGNGG